MTYRSEIFQPAECDANCDDPQCPYTHKPVLLRDAYDTLAAENAALKEQLATAEQARAVAEGNLELRSMSNEGLRQLIGEMVVGLETALRSMPIGFAATGKPGGADERNAALSRDRNAIRDLITRARGAAS